MNPSTLRDSTMSASPVGFARASSSRMGRPSHFWLPTRSPPTGLDTHASVTQASTRSLASSSSHVSVTSCSTMPCTRRLHVLGSTCGTTSAVSIR